MTAENTTRPAGRSRSATRPNLSQRGGGTQVASALRNAYEETVKENIPAEFLDLLGKLS